MNEWGVVGIMALIGLVGVAIWIWALVDAIRVPDDSMYKSGNKLVWVLVIVLAQWIGAIIYLAVGRPARGSSRVSPSPQAPAPPPPPPPV